jgi:hypothetical protein
LLLAKKLPIQVFLLVKLKPSFHQFYDLVTDDHGYVPFVVDTIPSSFAL